MKKIIFSSTLILSGVIGFIGILNACVNKSQPGAYSEVLSHVKGSDWILVVLCLTLVLVGFVISIKEFKNE